MCSLNEVTLIGRLGQDPKVIVKDDQTSFGTCQVGTNETWKVGNNVTNHVEWHTVNLNQAQVTYAAKYLHQGDKVLVRGCLRQKQWKDKNGVFHKAFQIQAHFVKLVCKKFGEPVQNGETTLD